MKLTALFLLVFSTFAFAQSKPKVWIITDMTDKTIKGTNKEGTVNDPDDISAMAGYLLISNQFETLGIVVASTHRKEHQQSANQADWANKFFGEAYKTDVNYLNKTIGGYPADLKFIQSAIKESAERFDDSKNYDSLEKYNSVKLLFETVEKQSEIVNILGWGSLTEQAILVKYCLIKNRLDILKKMRFISHWTNSSMRQGTPENPEAVANCREDAKACAYLKQKALDGWIKYYETGAIGQHGIVSGSPKGAEYFDQFKNSRIGKIFAEGKFAFNSVDHSDSATYWVLLGDWGVSLNDIKSNGTNFPEIEKANEEKFNFWSKRIHDELLRRSKIASQPVVSININ